MIRIRIRGEEIRLEPEEWTLWVQDGRIPPNAQVLIEDGRWVPAGQIPSYHRILSARGDRFLPDTESAPIFDGFSSPAGASRAGSAAADQPPVTVALV